MLLVVAPDASAADFVSLVAELSDRGRDVGIVPATSANALLQWLRRARDQTSIPFNPDRFLLIQAMAEPSDSATAPPSVAFGNALADADFEAHFLDSEFLYLVGHANAVDGGFGPAVTLCARPSAASSGSLAYPCFRDRRCFRQRDHARSSSSMTGLRDPADIRASLVVLAGCNSAMPIGTWFEPRHSMLDRFSVSSVTALIGAIGVTTTSIEADLYLICRLLEGVSFGTAVRDVNTFLSTRLKNCSGYPRNAGPFAVFGNPSASVSGGTVHNIKGERRGDTVRVNLNGVDFHRRSGAFIKLHLPRESCNDAPMWHFDERSDIWLRGAVPSTDSLYLWLYRSDANEPRDGELFLRKESPREARETHRRWQNRSRGHDFWREYLEQLSMLLMSRGGESNRLQMLLGVCAELENSVAACEVLTRPSYGIVVVASAAVRRYVEAVKAELSVFDSLCAEVIADALRITGTRIFRAWDSRWRHLDRLPMEARCGCGASLFGSLFQHPAREYTRYIAACPVCGPCAEGGIVGDAENARAIVPVCTAELMSRTVRRGDGVRWKLASAASDDGWAAAMIEDWNREHRIVGSAVRLRSSDVTEVAVNVPRDLAEGSYPSAIVATAGGKLTIWRDMINVGPY